MIKQKTSSNIFFLNRVFTGKKGMADASLDDYLKWRKGQESSSGGGRGNAPGKIGEARKKIRDVLSGSVSIGGQQMGGWMFIFMAGILYYLDLWLGYNGLNINKFLNNLAFIGTESYIAWFMNSIVITLLIAYYIIYHPDTKEFISFFFLAELLSLIIFLGGLGTSLVHLTFVFAFYFLYIRGNTDDPEKKTTANWITFALLAFDFFGFGILAEVLDNPIISNRLIIPIWFYYALIYTRNEERSFWVDMLIMMIIIGNVFYFVGGLDHIKNMSATLTPEEIKERENFISTSWKNVKDTIYKAIEGFRRDLDAQIEYATGGYYKGRMEKTKKEPLGVYITEVKAAETTFYQTEPVIIWGTLKANGVDEGIIMKVFCKKKVYSSSSVDYSGLREGISGTIYPDKPFVIYQKENRDFECRFDEKNFEGKGCWYDSIQNYAASSLGLKSTPCFSVGTHTISVGAEFGFSTLAYLRTYFMDEERLRSMRREGIDVDKEYGITSKNSVATYTTGPVSMGMEVTDKIIGVGTNTYTRLGVTLENIDGWEGEIKGVDEIVLLTPKGAIIRDPKNDCTKEFKPYTLKDCHAGFVGRYNGETSCEKYVLNPCVDTCAINKVPSSIKDAQEIESEKKKFIPECTTKCMEDYRSCAEDCMVLFESPDGVKSDYNAYVLDLEKERQYFNNLGRFRSFSCRVDIFPDILDSSPLTIKYFRAKARYNYSIKKDIEIKVEKDPYAKELEKEAKKAVGALPAKLEGTIPEKIIAAAKKAEVPEDLALALAWVESAHKHCCVSTGPHTSSNPCVQMSESQMENGKCPADHVITGYTGEAKGVFQITETTRKQFCSEMDISDVDKNIECGIKILQSYYKTYKGGCKRSSIYSNCEGNRQKYLTFCNGCDYCKSQSGNFYYNYKEWDAALRAYNGWGCAGYYDNAFVEKVNSLRSKMKELVSSNINAEGWQINVKKGVDSDYIITIIPGEMTNVDGLFLYVEYSNNEEFLETIDISDLEGNVEIPINVTENPVRVYAEINGDKNYEIEYLFQSVYP